MLKGVDCLDTFTSIDAEDNFGNEEPIGSKYNYLKVGTGNPWAGQLSESAWPPTLTNPEVTIFDGNFGADDPIAPVIVKINYPKYGSGNAWAGQVKVTLELDSLLIDEESTSLLNFGKELPIGSRKEIWYKLQT